MDRDTLSYKKFSFNHLKHHLAFTKEYCKHEKFLFDIKTGTKDFANELKMIGNNITDIYTGFLSIQNIIDEISYNLKENDLYERNKFIKLFREIDYHKIEITDGSVWIIRLGKNQPGYIHIHPARVGQHTIRFPANTWKTALLCYYFKLNNVGFEFELNTINYIRTSYLELPPIKRINQKSNINTAYNLLAETTLV